MMLKFKQWLEDAGEAHPQINDGPYAERGIRSMTANDAKRIKEKNLIGIFGRKRHAFISKNARGNGREPIVGALKGGGSFEGWN